MFRSFLGAVLLAGMAVSAQAAVVEATFTGRVFSGYDQSGLFGHNAFELDGARFVLTYVFDTDIGTRETVPNERDSLSRTAFGNPTVSARIEINNVTQSIVGDYISAYSVCNIGADTCSDRDLYNAFVLDTYDAEGVLIENYIRAGVALRNNVLPSRLDFSFAIELNSQEGRFEFTSFDRTAGFYRSYTGGYLVFDRLTVRNTSDTATPVPLPASAPLLLAALAGVAALRRRRLARV